MANPFYAVMGGGQQGGNFMQTLQQFKSNPVGFLLSRKLNIPADIANNPNAILNHLLTTGQITQGQVNSAYNKLQNGE